MSSRLSFLVNIEVAQKRSAEKMLTAFSQRVNRDLLSLTISRYWKIETQFQARFSVGLFSSTKETLVYETLELAAALRHKDVGTWPIVGQISNNDDTVDITLIYTNSTPNQPLRWACLELTGI